MRNADMPAMPSVHCTNDGITGDMIPDQWSGLTKREHFAAMAMQAILTQQPPDDVPDEVMADFMAQVSEYSTMAADALLAELERTK